MSDSSTFCPLSVRKNKKTYSKYQVLSLPLAHSYKKKVLFT